MAYIKTLKDNELIGGQDNTDVYPITSTQAVYSQKKNGSAPEGKKVLLEDRLTDMENQIDTPVGTDSIADGAVVTRKIADNAITTSKIDTGAITSEKIASNAITNDKIADNTIAGNKFIDDSIDGSKIKDNSVPGSKLADGAIESIDLQDNTLSGSKLADNSVDGDKLVDGAVTSSKLKDNSIDGSKIADDTIQSLDIKDGTISGAKLVNGTITGDKLADGIIDNNKIANNTITGDKFLDESISGEKIQPNTIHGSKLETGTVDGADIIEGTLNGNKIADMSVDGDKLADDSIETRHIKSNTISGSKIVTNSIDSTKIRNNSLIGENFEDGAITNAKIVDDAITNNKIANNTIASDKIADGAITTIKLANSSVGGASIADSAITNDKLQDGSIVNRNIATGTLIGDKFVDNTITGDKIIDNTLPGSKIKDGTIENVDIKDNTLSGAKLVNNSVDGTKLADNSITSSHLIDNSIPGSKIKDGTIENVDIKDGTLDGSKLKDGSILTAKIYDGAVTNAKIAAGAITTDKIDNLAVTESKLATGAVTNGNIANGAVTEDKLGAGSVTSDKIGDGSVTEAKLDTGAVTNTKLVDGSVTENKIGTGAVTTDKITNNAVTTAKIADLNVTTAKIADGAVTEDKLADGAITSDKIADDAITELQTIMDEVPTEDSVKPVMSGGVFNSVISSGVFDLSAHTGDSYADLSAALTAMSGLSAAYKKGGMSIKFVLSSDNKYVQYRLITTTWSDHISNWIPDDEAKRAFIKNLTEIGLLRYIDFTGATEGSYINKNGVVTQSSSFDYINGIQVHKGEKILFYALGYGGSVSMIAKQNESNYTKLVTSDTPNIVRYYEYTVTEDMTIALSYNNGFIHECYIVLPSKNAVNGYPALRNEMNTAEVEIDDIQNILANSNIYRTIDFTNATSGKYVSNNGNVYNDEKLSLLGNISINKGDKIVFKAKGYNTAVAMISKQETSSYTPLVISTTPNTVKKYTYTATEDMIIALSYYHTVEYSCWIFSNGQSVESNPLLQNQTISNNIGVFHKIGVIGDSLANGTFDAAGNLSYYDRTFSWPQILARKYGLTAVNFTTGGATTRTALSEYVNPASFAESANLCMAYIIGLGVNDRYQAAQGSPNGVVLGSPSDIDLNDRTQCADTYYGNYASIIMRIKEVQPKAKIFCITRPATVSETSGYNEAIRYMATIFSDVYIIDLYQYGMDIFYATVESSNVYWYKSHMTALGYEMASRHIASCIDYIIKTNGSSFRNTQFIGTDYHY